MQRFGAVDVGGTKMLAAVAPSCEARSLAVVRRHTPRDDPVSAIVELLGEAGGDDPLDRVAVASPGPLDRARGRLLQPPNLSPDWWNRDLTDELTGRLGCPVTLENDANCAALAEAVHGAGRAHRRVAYMTVSTGIGTGLVDDGAIVEPDAEGGHQVVAPDWTGSPECACGARGCLESLASGGAIARRFGVPAEQLDDPSAWRDVGRSLGVGLANLAALQAPDVIVLGGGVMGSAPKFWDSLCASYERHARLRARPAVVPAQLGAERNLVGALALSASSLTGVGSRPSRAGAAAPPG